MENNKSYFSCNEKFLDLIFKSLDLVYIIMCLEKEKRIDKFTLCQNTSLIYLRINKDLHLKQ